jgi:hypothetical protein
MPRRLLRYPGVVTVVLFSLFLARAEASERGRDGTAQIKVIREVHVKEPSRPGDGLYVHEVAYCEKGAFSGSTSDRSLRLLLVDAGRVLSACEAARPLLGHETLLPQWDGRKRLQAERT